MNPAIKKGVIEPEALRSLLAGGHPVRLVDGTYPAGPGVRIGDAAAFDIDAVADPDNDLPHMLPSPENFAAAVSAFGISNDDFIVVYDRSGLAMAAARVWWTFRVFGHDNICVLNGGLPAWIAAGGETRSGPPAAPRPARFRPSFRPGLVRSMEEIRAAAPGDPSAAVLDARAPARFAGSAPEPRPGLRAGHIPGSFNVPYTDVLDPATGRLKPPEDLQNIFYNYVNKNTLITSCGSGVTACVLALALFSLGFENAAVYDGSWAEWGRPSSQTPVAC